MGHDGHDDIEEAPHRAGDPRPAGPGERPERDDGRNGGAGTLPEAAFGAALASLPGIGPRSLGDLLADRTPSQAWRALVDGRAAPLAQPGAAVRAARALDVGATWESYVREGVAVATLGDEAYPRALAVDPQAPAVLFCIGDPSVLDRHARVAIVGTRSATRYGLGLAAQLAGELTAAGIVVVSGLALGIDGAAHEGAVAAWHAADGDGGGAAPPVAVVAGSVTTPYPGRHAGLWARVAQAGAVVSEAPIGSADLAWRFPMRNRIIAALADVVVVVECHARGGSLHTVRAATARAVPVGAVPGSVRSPASAGTNALLADGCFVVRDVSDVLAAVGIATAGRPRVRVPATRPASPPWVAAPFSGRPLRDTSTERPTSRAPTKPDRGGPAESQPPEGDRREAARRGQRDQGEGEAARCGQRDQGEGEAARAAVLDALGWERCSLDDVVERTALALGTVCHALEWLQERGTVHGEGGSWERT